MKKNNIKYLIGAIFVVAMGISSCSDDKDLGGKMTPNYLLSSITLGETGYDSNDDTICILKNQSLQLSWTVSPDSATNKNIAFSSTDTSVVKVSSTGLITSGSTTGTSVLSVTPEVGFGATAATPTRVIRVMDSFVDITSISFTNPPSDDLGIGDDYTLTVKALPSNATFKRYTWTSSDESIATVDEDGVVTGKGVGQVTITATSDDYASTKVSTSATFNVIKITPVTSISFASDSELSQLGYGETYQTQYTVTPSDATTSVITWKSSDTSVVKVAKYGILTANTTLSGSAKITARYGNVSSSTTVSVVAGRLCYSFASKVAPWSLTSGSKSSSDGTKTTVSMVAQSSGKYRSDLTLYNTTTSKMYLTPGAYRYLAIKIRPSAAWVPGSNSAGCIKLNMLDASATIGYYPIGSVSSANNSYTILSGSSLSTTSANVLYYDLQGKYDTYNPSTWTTFGMRIFKFVIADFPSKASTYDVYWVRSFKSVSDLQTFVNSEN